jgi:hypothetical protein
MLRNLIIGLLLANLLLLAWGRWIVAPDVADPRAFGEATGAQLVLIKRVVRNDGAGSSPGQDGARCFRLGPFASVDAAADVGSRLSARGLPVDRTSESGQIWVGHWVQLLDLPSEEVARQAVRKLISGGIGDAYISSHAPTINVSLGVFRGRQGADDVIRLAGDLGYTVEAMDRFRAGIEYWIEVETSADQPPDLADLPLAKLKSGEAQIIRVEERPCALAVADAGNGNDDGTEADDSLESPAQDTGSSEPSTSPE